MEPICPKCEKAYKINQWIFRTGNVVEFVYKKDCNCVESKATTV